MLNAFIFKQVGIIQSAENNFACEKLSLIETFFNVKHNIQLNIFTLQARMMAFLPSFPGIVT